MKESKSGFKVIESDEVLQGEIWFVNLNKLGLELKGGEIMKKERSPRQKHQFRRYRAKGMISGTLNQFLDIARDSENFTTAEQLFATSIIRRCRDLLTAWQATID